jgi:ketosteroid isomerase-like protein
MNSTTNLHHDATSATRELVSMFAAALCAGDGPRLVGLLAHDVVHQVPGRSSVAGIHRGIDAVRDSLTVPAVTGAVLDDVRVTELLCENDRAFLTIEMSGAIAGRPFRFETGFHVQSDGEHIIAVTEYSGDQYAADAAVGTEVGGAASSAVPPVSIATSSTRSPRWWRRLR